MTSATGILHLRAPCAESLIEFLKAQDHSTSQIEEWLHYGSVYIDGRRQRSDRPLQEGQVIRLHTRRKSYLKGVPLKPRVIFDHHEFLVLDKPSGLPTHPTLDNFIENAKYQLEQELGHPVFVTHRLDIVTQGLLVFAKTKEAQALINKIFAKGRAQKFYSALVTTPLAPGEIVHYMDPEGRAPRHVQSDPRPDWWECRLRILDCQAHANGYKLMIQLLTGKTHQIRAQLAALGAPVIGDKDYGSTFEVTEVGLECSQLAFRFRLEDILVKREAGSAF